jgi:hypothetical protein
MEKEYISSKPFPANVIHSLLNKLCQTSGKPELSHVIGHAHVTFQNSSTASVANQTQLHTPADNPNPSLP